ncbi:ComEA family DNA-binding protein [Maribacter sp. 2-571]|uniref:ComEA family DNA-binding protein n=1 Tax=Maribacter sp. 2-571 TaxID=3417569 RepID=UPI003D334B03
MKRITPHFKLNKQERNGVFFLLFLIISIQIGYICYRSFPSKNEAGSLAIDSVRSVEIEKLKTKSLEQNIAPQYDFNPNFITDYKGYALGMSVAEIDRLLEFRAQNRFVHSAAEFQKVTQISDSLLGAMKGRFRFPEWTKQRKTAYGNTDKTFDTASNAQKNAINSATAEALREIPGIGEKLSVRIVKFRDRLGGFMVMEQLYDVYGLEAEVAERVFKRYSVQNLPDIQSINVNEASVSQLVKLIYIRYAVAQEIVSYREQNGPFRSFSELEKITDFPFDKIDRIALYLSL